jgi:peptide/nickel transport system substrate-binding protein
MTNGIEKIISRRAFLGGSLAAGGLILAGCTSKAATVGSGATGTATGAATGAATSAAAAPTAVSTVKNLRIGLTGNVVLAGLQRFTAQNQPLRRTVFNYLMDKTPSGDYTPSLATSWEWSADKLTLVINLRDGVTYHTGRAFGPDDVIASIQAALATGSGAQAAALLKYANGVKKSGPSQVTATFDSPFPKYLDGLSMLPIIDSATYSDAASGKQVVGTGPFVWKSWTAGSKIEMEKYGSYWQEGKPYFETLEMSISTSPEALLAAMQSGQLDMVNGMVARDAATLQKTGKFSVLSSAGYDVYLGINTAVKPLDNQQLRQAIAYSIDRERIVSQIYSGLAKASCIPWASDTPGVTDEQVKRYAYDLDKAKSLVEAAGAKGAEIAYTPWVADAAVLAMADIVEYGLTQIGLKVKPVRYDAATFSKHLQGGDLPGLWVTNVALTAMGPATALLTANPLTTNKNSENFTPPEYKSKVDAVVTSDSDSEAKAIAGLTDFMLDSAFHNAIVQGQTSIAQVSGLTGVNTDLTLAFDLTNAKLSS